jgi:hypothetical protein
MNLVKCPRCDLNYIQETEKLCKVCQRDMKGEQASEEMEMCSVCNAAPALPGHDVCLGCLKEMNTGTTSNEQDDANVADGALPELSSVSTMDEIIPQIDEDIPETEYGDIQNELSLEGMMEEENRDEDEEEEE